jgi:CBS domain containing-hemolysin-like protein
MTLLILYGFLAIGVSFLCSILEASLLSLPRSQLEALVERGSGAARVLQGMKHNIDRPLAAILTLNTVAHTVGAAGVGAQAAHVFGNLSVGIVSAAMTLAILVFSEIIPKTLGAVHAKRLVGMTAYITRGMIFLCWPLIISLEYVNRLVGFQRHKERITRSEVLATIRLGREGGSLGPRESRVVSNVLALANVHLGDILTPRTVVFALPTSMTVAEAIAQHNPLRFSRIPLVGDSPDHIHHYVLRADIHKTFAEGAGDQPLAAIAQPVPTYPEQATVSDTLYSMLESRQHLAIVVDEYGGTEGIVTMEDLIETLLGEEIVDETDEVADLQAYARRRAQADAGQVDPYPEDSDAAASDQAASDQAASDQP